MAEPTYFAAAIESLAGANKRHLTLWNGVGSGKTLKVYRVVAGGSPTAAVTGLVIPLRAVKISGTVPAGGAPITASKADPTNAAIPSQIDIRTGSTAASTEDASPFGIGSVTGEETQAASFVPLFQAPLDGTQPIVCAEGSGVLVRQGTLASAGAVMIVVTFTLV